MYSLPGRSVQTCLQVTEQVWQPMHLSRAITIAICARTLTGLLRSLEPQGRRALAQDHDLVALRAGRPVVVERPRELCVAADEVRGLHHDSRSRVVGATALAFKLGQGHV